MDKNKFSLVIYLIHACTNNYYIMIDSGLFIIGGIK